MVVVVVPVVVVAVAVGGGDMNAHAYTGARHTVHTHVHLCLPYQTYQIMSKLRPFRDCTVDQPCGSRLRPVCEDARPSKLRKVCDNDISSSRIARKANQVAAFLGLGFVSTGFLNVGMYRLMYAL